MVKHAELNRTDLTFGDVLEPAMEVQTEEEASEYLKRYVEHVMRTWGKDRAAARATCLTNIGYYTGYHDAAIAERVLRLFETAHPMFGKTRPSPEEAIRIGKEWAEGRGKHEP